MLLKCEIRLCPNQSPRSFYIFYLNRTLFPLKYITLNGLQRRIVENGAFGCEVFTIVHEVIVKQFLAWKSLNQLRITRSSFNPIQGGLNTSYSGGVCAIIHTPTNFWTTGVTKLKFYMIIDIHKLFQSCYFQK